MGLDKSKEMFFAAAIQKRACETHAAVDRLSYDQQPNAFIKTVSSEGGGTVISLLSPSIKI